MLRGSTTTKWRTGDTNEAWPARAGIGARRNDRHSARTNPVLQRASLGRDATARERGATRATDPVQRGANPPQASSAAWLRELLPFWLRLLVKNSRAKRSVREGRCLALLHSFWLARVRVRTMRQQNYRRALATLCLGLLLSGGLASANRLVVCWAPGGHVAIEVAAAFCRASEAAHGSERASADSLMSSRSVACIDRSITQDAIGSPKAETPSRPAEHAIPCVALISPPWREPVLLRHGDSTFSNIREPRFIRSVILLV